ncbi:hypothetical protein EJG51_013055 [Undibacterium piscinae]|uniref:Uncharacterized protein n=2 Tax=Undibacterium TaxID=401469 RepID=A0A6M4A5K3_9BURK|nr:hypothetical protein EJG51_013055 [Undibacterium piscinae]
MQDNFWALYTVAFGWIVLVAIASVLYRKIKSKPMRIVKPENSLFMERWTSGRSLRNFVSRLGGARNCLFVAVTRNELIVRPHFPFTMFFLPEIYGLEIVVPRSAVRSVEIKSGLLGSSVLLNIDRSPGESFRLELRLRAPTEFAQAMVS